MEEQQKVEHAKYLIYFISAGLKVLSVRFSLMLALTLSFLLFAWSMSQPDVWRFASATVFAILVFIPTVYLDFRASNKE